MTALEKMVSQLIDDPSCLEQPCFREALAAVAVDFCRFARRFNAGNRSGYNLRQAGKRIDAIEVACAAIHEAPDHPKVAAIYWPMVLADIKRIGEVAWFEFEANTVLMGPDGTVTDQYGAKHTYTIEPPISW